MAGDRSSAVKDPYQLDSAGGVRDATELGERRKTLKGLKERREEFAGFAEEGFVK